jgi:hypothetical protein
MDSSAAATPSTAAKSSPAAAQPSPFTAAAAKSLPAAQPAPSTAAAQPAAPIPIVVDDAISPSPTTSGGASHTPSFFDNSMDVEDNEHEIGDGHRGSVRNTGSMGMGRGGRPPSYKRAKTVSKPSAAWEHFTRDETSSQDEPMAHCNYCGTGYKCHPKVNGTSSMLYHVGNCAQYKSLKARQDKSQTKFTFEAKSGEGNALMIAKYDEKKNKKCTYRNDY